MITFLESLIFEIHFELKRHFYLLLPIKWLGWHWMNQIRNHYYLMQLSRSINSLSIVVKWHAQPFMVLWFWSLKTHVPLGHLQFFQIQGCMLLCFGREYQEYFWTGWRQLRKCHFSHLHFLFSLLLCLLGSYGSLDCSGASECLTCSWICLLVDLNQLDIDLKVWLNKRADLATLYLPICFQLCWPGKCRLETFNQLLLRPRSH